MLLRGFAAPQKLRGAARYSAATAAAAERKDNAQRGGLLSKHQQQRKIQLHSCYEIAQNIRFVPLLMGLVIAVRFAAAIIQNACFA